MDYFIKVAIIVLAVGLLIAMLSPLIDKVVEGFSLFASEFFSLTSFLAPYLLFARSALNYLVGNSAVCDIILWFILLAPFSEHLAVISNKIYKRLTN